MNSGAWPSAAKPSRVKRLGLMLALVVAALATSAGPAQADDTQCVLFEAGVHDNIVVPEGMACSIGPAVVKGNIFCREGSTCYVGATGPVTVKGSITCDEGATCVIFDSTVYGNAKCDGCDLLDVSFSYVRGNVQSTNSAAGSAIFAVEVGGDVEFEGTGQLFNLSDSQVGGDVQIGKTRLMLPAVLLAGLDVSNNAIDGNIQIVETTASNQEIVDNDVGHDLQFFKNRGTSDISDNTILGNLQCKENFPAPMGGGNVAKQKEEQCAAL